MKKSLKTVLIISLILFAAGAACCITALANVGFNVRKLSPERHTQKHSQEMVIGNIKDINISTEYSDIKVYPSKDGKLHLSYYTSDEFDFKINKTANTLTVSETATNKVWYEYLQVSFGSDDVKLVVEVPESFNGNIDVKSDNSDATVNGVKIGGELSVNSFDDVAITKFSGSDVTVNSENGEISCSDIKVLKSMNVSTSSGDVVLGNINCAGTLSCSSDSSEIRHTGLLKAKIINFSSDTGSVSLDKIDSKKTSIKAENGNISGISVGRESEYTIFAKADTFIKKLNTGTVNGDRVINLESEYGEIDWSFTK